MYYQLHPFGHEIQNRGLAQISSLLFNIHRDQKKTNQATVEDFMPKITIVPERSSEEKAAQAKTIGNAFDGFFAALAGEKD